MQTSHKIGFALVLTAMLGTAWWMAGHTDQHNPGTTPEGIALPRDRGPLESAFCGPLRAPLPPPPIDSPYGLHLYATTPKGIIHDLPVMEIAYTLQPPPQAPSAKPISAPVLNETPKNETLYDDVQTVSTLLEEYRRAFGAMPTGELNDEIVRRLQGENPLGIAVLPKGHPSISPQGELLDRYGTPYRFHPESAWEMTVRSAGPDQKMWTGDDQISQQDPTTTQL